MLRPKSVRWGSGNIVTLYNRNYQAENVGENVDEKLSPIDRRKRILELAAADQTITIEKLRLTLGISAKTVERDLEKLKMEKAIEYTGDAKTGYWKVK